MWQSHVCDRSVVYKIPMVRMFNEKDEVKATQMDAKEIIVKKVVTLNAKEIIVIVFD